MTEQGIYIDEATGRAITTHSMIKSMQRCPKATQYKYVERLKVRYATANDKPLKRGTWFHALLEEYYAGRSWRLKHQQLTAQFGELFDEERDALGDLPRELEQLMKSYLWHYGANKDDPFHGWKVHETELTLECPWPDGKGLYRCRLDMLVEDEYGLWIVDHKTHKTLPGSTFRLLDHASALYIWCAQRNKIPVQGFIWNYIRTKAPTKPALVYKGKPNEGLSKVAIDTDYPTYVRALKEYGLPIEGDYLKKARYLLSQRWKPGEVQSSSFFRRETLEKDTAMLKRVVAKAMRTRNRMNTYNWTNTDAVEVSPDRSCDWMCRFTDLCTAELFGGNTDLIRRTQFRVGDPMDYYKDDKDEMETTGA